MGPSQGRANRKKHGVSFSDAEAVLLDPYSLTSEDPGAGEEQRFVALGMDAIGRILVVVYAYDGNDVRILSAIKPSSGERKHYEK